MHEREERGFAHFIEHLLFRGTEHFQDGEIFRYLESIGASKGADTNAFTWFQTTTYQLEIPLGKKNSLDVALCILRDFAASALFSPDAIEKERTVVLDELYQTESSAESTLSCKAINTFLAHSPYANRFPIWYNPKFA